MIALFYLVDEVADEVADARVSARVSEAPPGKILAERIALERLDVADGSLWDSDDFVKRSSDDSDWTGSHPV